MRNGVDISTVLNKKNIIVFGSLYLLIFVLSKVMLNTEWILGLTQESIPYKLLYHLIGRVCRIIYAALGVAFIYLLINYLLNNKIIIVTPEMIKLSSYCFGVYIFQQFILMPFVNNSIITKLFGTYWLPWVAFIFALIGSIVLTWVTRQTKVGRMLIG